MFETWDDFFNDLKAEVSDYMTYEVDLNSDLDAKYSKYINEGD